MTRRVLVVGGGVAGAAVAALLGRAGDDVTLVERDRGQRTSGSPVDVRGGALPVVERLGLVDALREHDTGARYVEFVDEHGRTRARATMRRNTGADVEISRCALTGILLRTASAVARVVHDDGPARIDGDGAGVDVTFESGEQARFDVVVGADGQHSTVRHLAFGPEALFSAPFGITVATTPVHASLAPDTQVVRIVTVPGASLGLHPAGGHPTVAFIFRTGTDRPAERCAQLQVLEHHYAGMVWPAAETLRCARETDDLYYDTVSRVAVPSWSSGRVVLLGDAASSITILGEGCSMALTGAAALADALAGTDDVGAALAAYERGLRPKVVSAQRGAGTGASVLVPRTSRGIVMRDLMVRILRRV